MNVLRNYNQKRHIFALLSDFTLMIYLSKHFSRAALIVGNAVAWVERLFKVLILGGVVYTFDPGESFEREQKGK